MNKEMIIKYHIWINLILGVLNFLTSFLFLFYNSPPYSMFWTLTIIIETIVFGIFGIFVLIYYIARKTDLKFIILSILNLIYFLIIGVGILGSGDVIKYGFIISGNLAFFYTLYLKWSMPKINKKK